MELVQGHAVELKAECTGLATGCSEAEWVPKGRHGVFACQAGTDWLESAVVKVN